MVVPNVTPDVEPVPGRCPVLGAVEDDRHFCVVQLLMR